MSNPVDLEHVQVLRLQPGDVLVVKSGERYLNAEEAARLQRQVEVEFPGHKCIVLAPGMDLAVAREEEAS